MARLTQRNQGAFFDRGVCFKWLAAARNPPINADGVVAAASGGMLTLKGALYPPDV